MESIENTLTLFKKIVSIENLRNAFQKAKKGKGKKKNIIKFGGNQIIPARLAAPEE